MSTFFVLQKCSFPSWSCRLYLNVLRKHPVMFSTDLHQSSICSVTNKACNFAIKRDSSLKIFLEVTKGIDLLQQNTLDKLRFLPAPIRSSERVLLLNLKTISTCFEHDIFHNNLKNNVYGQVFSYKYYRLLPKQESITDFFVGITSPPKISRNCHWWSQFLI